MRQKNTHTKTPVITAIIASVCIIVYLAALVFAAVRIYISIDERRMAAEREFFDIADLASSAGVLGFMDEPFVQTMEDALIASRTLEGLIISGPHGEYAFERERGAVVNRVNNSPRFKTRFDLLKDLYVPLRIEGLRNVTIQAAAGLLDYDVLTAILKRTLLLILAALLLAFFTLLLESLIEKARYAPHYGGEKSAGKDGGKPAAVDSSGPPREEAKPEETEAPSFNEDASAGPKGLFSPHGNIGWEAYTTERLTAELHRCASFEQDLVFIVMEFKEPVTEAFYNQFAGEAVNFFTLRDLIFEKGQRGMSIIYPNIDLDMGFTKSEEFHNRILSKYSGAVKSKTDLCIGLSSRSGRLIDAERLMFEAAEALERALADPVSHIVAFKSDPEKYRAFIRRGLENPEA
ncbi:MAG: hypothetical protein LBE14_08735 [Treponema sp.]|jgi:hypothetical protein|nr:hypothetical protein [Treponema sp.]